MPSQSVKVMPATTLDSISKEKFSV
jgi:hypothetical protein